MRCGTSRSFLAEGTRSFDAEQVNPLHQCVLGLLSTALETSGVKSKVITTMKGIGVQQACAGRLRMIGACEALRHVDSMTIVGKVDFIAVVRKSRSCRLPA